MVLVDVTAIPPSMVLPTGIAGWVHQNANHRHIPAEAKEVFDLGKSLFLNCAFVLPDAAQELTRGEDFVTHAPGNDLGPHRHEQTQGNAEFFANVNGSHICRGAAKKLGPKHSKRTTKAYSRCRVCYHKHNTCHGAGLGSASNITYNL